MDVSELKELAEKLAEKREQVNCSKEYLEGLKAEKDVLQQNLLDALKSVDVKSIKTENCFFSMVTKQEPVVVDIEALESDLKARKLYDDLVVTKIDSTRLKSTAKALLKETGEVMSGMEIRDTNYISIRNNK